MGKNKYVSLILILCCVFPIFSLGGKEKQIDDITKNNLLRFVDEIFVFCKKGYESRDIDLLFLSGKVWFEIEDKNIPSLVFTPGREVDAAYNGQEYKELQKRFRNYAGDYVSRSLLSCKFVQNVYDMVEGDLYLLEYNVVYENILTNEFFYLKVKNGSVYIYRYRILFNSNSLSKS